MKFNEYKYERPDYNQYKEQLTQLTTEFNNCSSSKEQLAIFKKATALRSHIQSMSVLAEIRFSINTQDDYYQKESAYWDEHSPLYEDVNQNFYHALLNSKYRQELTKDIPEVYFQLLECGQKAFSSTIIEDLQQENKLITEYSSLIASAQITYEDKVYTLKQLAALTSNANRDKRHSAYDARMSFFADNKAKIDDIYDQLVKVRTKMAQKLGYQNYIELGYYRMCRLDYNEQDVSNYRQQVLNDIVPLANQIYDRQMKRLGLNSLAYYDLPVEFIDGNATPIGSAEDIIASGKEMYHELSKETDEFFSFMLDHELLDLVAKKGKQGGGYCNYIDEYKSPFIFSNFNGTSDDINVLTHEAGHAFECYQSRWISIPDLMFPTYEACEIHSMSMEFFTWPYMEKFFNEKADRYRYSHLCGTITFLPYGVLVDHFQHEVYAHPEYTPQQRCDVWRNLEKQYCPSKNFDGCEVLNQGGWWYQQAHIFATPFYYIDYTLAQACALQFFIKIQNQDPNAWKDYLHLCSLGGTKSFTGLVKEAKLKVPFENNSLKEIASTVQDYLTNIDDSKL